MDDHGKITGTPPGISAAAAACPTCAAVADELRQAAECLRDYGDADYPEMTQGGNQGLRHVHQALALLEGTAGEAVPTWYTAHHPDGLPRDNQTWRDTEGTAPPPPGWLVLPFIDTAVGEVAQKPLAIRADAVIAVIPNPPQTYMVTKWKAVAVPLPFEQVLDQVYRAASAIEESIAVAQPWEHHEPGELIASVGCPCCGAALSVEHGDDPGEVAVVGSPANPRGGTGCIIRGCGAWLYDPEGCDAAEVVCPKCGTRRHWTKLEGWDR